MNAPIACFAFNRPQHLLNTLESLSKNPEFTSSPLYLFCDGARDAVEQSGVDKVRDVAKSFPHPNKIIYESESNKGLRQSVYYGIDHVFKSYDKVIVVEDDLIVSSRFLDFINRSLDFYQNNEKVVQVSGYMFPVKNVYDHGASFLPFSSSWGWGTWKRVWNERSEDLSLAKRLLQNFTWRYKFDLFGAYPYSKMLNNRIAGRNNSWAIWFYFQIFMGDGLVLYPNRTLVNNDGFDGSGTHCKRGRFVEDALSERNISCLPSDVEVNAALFNKVRWVLMRQRGLLRCVVDVLWRFFGRIAK